MSRVKVDLGKPVEVNEIRKMLREELIDRYGSITKFVNSSHAEKFGGDKIRPYLYDSGPINFSILRDICEYLGIGALSRKIIVKRTCYYRLIIDK